MENARLASLASPINLNNHLNHETKQSFNHQRYRIHPRNQSVRPLRILRWHEQPLQAPRLSRARGRVLPKQTMPALPSRGRAGSSPRGICSLVGKIETHSKSSH